VAIIKGTDGVTTYKITPCKLIHYYVDQTQRRIKYIKWIPNGNMRLKYATDVKSELKFSVDLDRLLKDSLPTPLSKRKKTLRNRTTCNLIDT